MAQAEALRGKQIVLGVGGGIAAYKSVELLRRLMDAGATVIPILTEAALHFVGVSTFSALASEPAKVSLWNDTDSIPHTRLGKSADLILVSPATADLIGRYAGGIASDLLTTTLIATQAPVIMVAAMHSEMWEHPAVVENVAKLRERGVTVVEPEAGRLAGGDVGVGRLAGVDEIIDAALVLFGQPSKLAKRRVLVSAGGTREPIDAVRFIGNRSSGKQGHALARMAKSYGADVTLVTTSESYQPPGIEVVNVGTAQEMFDFIRASVPDFDLVIMAAAVADFRPKVVFEQKIKKSGGLPIIGLEATPDILAYLGEVKKPGQVLIGFAAEAGSVLSEARRKRKVKNCDFIVANNILEPGAGFESDTNHVVVVGNDGVTELERADKGQIARQVLDIAVAWAFEKGIWV